MHQKPLKQTYFGGPLILLLEINPEGIIHKKQKDQWPQKFTGVLFMIVNCKLLEVNYNNGTHTGKQSIITWKKENTKFYDYDYKNFMFMKKPRNKKNLR